MTGNRAAAGCLFLVGAFLVAPMIDLVGQGEFGPATMLLLMAGVPFWGAWALIAGERRQAQAFEQATVDRAERLILEVAAANGGRVTPALVALHGRRITVSKARQLLESLAAEGLCAADSDEHGNLVYLFPVQGRAREDEELTPTEWVERMSGALASRRMTGTEESVDPPPIAPGRGEG